MKSDVLIARAVKGAGDTMSGTPHLPTRPELAGDSVRARLEDELFPEHAVQILIGTGAA